MAAAIAITVEAVAKNMIITSTDTKVARSVMAEDIRNAFTVTEKATPATASTARAQEIISHENNTNFYINSQLVI